jgi:hypothetical protein
MLFLSSRLQMKGRHQFLVPAGSAALDILYLYVKKPCREARNPSICTARRSW